jgi:hypothetical protein
MLTEQEELELLELENENAVLSSSSHEPATGSQYKKHGIIGSLFPATTSTTERGGNFLSRAISGAGDVLTLPVRAGSAIATGAGTLAGRGSLSEAASEAINDLSRNKSEKRGALGFIQNIGYDPTSSPLLGGTGIAAKGLKTIPRLSKAIFKTVGTGAATGGGSAAYQSAQEGNVDIGETAKQAGLGVALGGVGAGFGRAATKSMGKLLSNSALRNVNIEMKPGPFGNKVGFSAENVIKYDLVGTPREVYKQSQKRLRMLNNMAKEIGAESPEQFNISEMFDDVKAELSARNNPEGYANQIQLIDNAKKAYVDAFGEVVDASSAMEIRSRIGDRTAFVGRVQGGKKVDPDADWKEDVYNDLYKKFKTTLHEKLGGKLKEINKIQSEIIPIKQVAERRIPIAESNQRIGLSDLLTSRLGQTAAGGIVGAGIGAGASGGDYGGGALKGLAAGAALAGGRRLLGSPAATKLFYKSGKKFEKGAEKINDISNIDAGKLLAEKAKLKNRPGSIGLFTPTRQKIIDETMPFDFGLRNKATEGMKKSEEAYKRVEEALKKLNFSPTYSKLSDTEGARIAKMLGIRYNGIQEGIGKIPDRYTFTSLTPNAESTFLAKDLSDAKAGLKRLREEIFKK